MLLRLKWLFVCLCALPVARLSGKVNKGCPIECSCSLDEFNRYQAICAKGGLEAIPVDQLDPNVKVIVIKGPRNTIKIAPLFPQFQKLQVLRITDSNLPAIGQNAFWGLKELRILDLSKNNITNITENNFRGQDNLHELDLSKNKIFFMASSIFGHLKELRRLNLADNSIVELVQRNFFMLSRLKYLDLSGNPLQDLQPDVFRDVPELKVFKCRNCQLKKINPQLYNLLPLLSELDLGRNEFKFLDKDEFRDVKRLTKVLLDGNQLSVVVDELFRMQKSLDHLDLSYNRLAKVPNDSFLHLTNLTYLDLSYNKLVRLEPQAIRKLHNLRTLNISGNIQMDLHEMRETFEQIPQLTHLAIADMGMLPADLLVPFKQLRYLNISGNHLDNMSLQIIDSCRELEFLDLSRNQLYGINDDTALRIQGIKNVRLDNNPLICDECHMGKLINVVRELKWKWETYPICFLPKSLRGSEINNLDITGLDACLEYITDEEQNAASTSHNFLERGGLNTLAILGGIIFVLISIIILSMAICFSKHRARYYTREDHLNGSEAKCLEKNLESVTIASIGNGNSPTTTTTTTAANTTATTTPASNSLNGNGHSVNNALIGLPCSTSISDAGKEINFKFPIDDSVCTIDELVLPQPAPAPAATTTTQIKSNELPANSLSSIMFKASQSTNHRASNATALAAVAAAATVIPPGVPSATATEAVVILLSPPPSPPVAPTACANSVASSRDSSSSATTVLEQQIDAQQQRQQLQQQQQLHLSTLEPLLSVN